MRTSILFLCSLAVLVGCGSRSTTEAVPAIPSQPSTIPQAVTPPVPQPPPVPQVNSDPSQLAVQSFDSFARSVLSELKKKYEGQYNLADRRGQVIPTTVTFSEQYKYDIQKSDSLLAPFKAYIVVPMRTVGKSRGIEIPVDSTIDLECAFKNGQWVLETDLSRAFKK